MGLFDIKDRQVLQTAINRQKMYDPLRKSEVNDINGNVNNDIEKSEGSRGGKVIGHTKSGKPIYEESAFKKLSEKLDDVFKRKHNAEKSKEVYDSLSKEQVDEYVNSHKKTFPHLLKD